ncbi:MAG: glutamate-1-semialdehyde 2,1-aminomutase, partial [Thermodesulfobacteriota bacterium]|nr:glutamate-1-semialdehyde 2,1-aminomutase [Thermodesulfobacteriota bacterium]
YHGHADTLLVAAGSGVATLNIPGSPGIPESVVTHTLSLKYNDIEGFKKIMEEKGDSVAGVIVEPVAGNMGMIQPVKGFHEALREYTAKHGSLLIFDEVMTGFRVAKGSAQGLFGITPDLTCFGKIIGGGLPVGAYGGRKDIMNHIAPDGPVYQAGTLSGNPLAMAAGIATLKELKKPGFYEDLDAKSEKLINGIRNAAANAGIKVNAGHVGSMAGLFFTEKEVKNFDDAKSSDLDMFAAYYNGMLEKGVYLAPSQFEALFVSAAHSNEDIEKTIAAASEVMEKIRK